MSKSFGDGWKSEEVFVDKLWLDDKNPRLDLSPGCTQDEIREELILREDVIDLAVQIATKQKLLAGERVIVTLENGHLTVLEGNRRVAAIQILRKPTLLSKQDQKRLPAIPASLRNRLTKIPADIAPDRMAAEPILTKRHTERGVRPWSTLANMRRVFRYFEEGRSIDEICSALVISKGRATQLIRGYKLLEMARSAKGWSASEKQQLSDPKLVTSGFTRFFTLRDARIKLGLGFDKQQEPTSSASKAEFKELVQRIAHGFLIQNDENGRTEFDTRSTASEVLDGTPRAARQAAKTKEAHTTKVKSPTASDFFENLACLVKDNHLLKLTDELKNIEYTKRPAAACMLLRAIFECALVYQLKKKKLWTSLVETKKGKDPSLDVLMSFCANEQNNVFTEKRICTLLSNSAAIQAKDYLDMVTHGRWAEADPAHLRSIAIRLRKVIAAILEDSQ